MQTPFRKDKTVSGWWIKSEIQNRESETPDPQPGDHAIRSAITRVTRPVFLVNQEGHPAVAKRGTICISDPKSSESRIPKDAYELYAYAPPLHPEDLGDPTFKKRHNLRYAYIAGAMANGITSVKMVEKMGSAGMMGFFGAAGLSLDDVEGAISTLQERMKSLPFGFNLIHSPNDPELEAGVVDLYLERGIRLVSASAYMDMTLPLVYFRVRGIYRDEKGAVVCQNKIIAKVSRIEVARKFFSPPPEKLLTQLIEKNLITKEEALLADSIPMAEDLTAEADSGGHTDNRPAISLLPTIIALRNELTEKYKYERPPCVGLAGGISTPESAAGAFAMGAAYVLTGSVNQSCTEAGTSETVRQMLAQARQADVIMAPAADMFELGVKVQVLKRGTMFPLRAAKLYDLYCRYNSLADIPADQRAILERDFFRKNLEDEWHQTKNFFATQDPRQITRAEHDPKHKMALVFRSYLGQSSRWATQGEPSRKIDYQIWCGPALGAFNEWVKGSFLEKTENRKTVTVAMNLLLGAAVITRFNWLRSQGAVLSPDIGRFSPMELSELRSVMRDA
ncbi:PfaD family polyunsaturated fatty acid/polyketide biosynthesis protein [Desulfococcaceae bacterium HSG8]|nr:PfaD family polyunsaturated fatty acid/polyketide biosynthesis protein [Desulfococcaceae bacterium HSG8]